jgi:hypothetical protein
VEQPATCLDSEIDFLILALFFGLQIFRDYIYFLVSPHSPARLDTFVLAKVSKTACQSNALCYFLKWSDLLMRSPTAHGGRLLRGPSLAPVARAGKAWLTESSRLHWNHLLRPATFARRSASRSILTSLARERSVRSSNVRLGHSALRAHELISRCGTVLSVLGKSSCFDEKFLFISQTRL